METQVEHAEKHPYEIRFQQISCAASAEDVFLALYEHDPYAFWLDSARRPHPASRFSYMGGFGGPLSSHVRYNVSTATLAVTRSSGATEEVRGCDVLDYLKAELRRIECDEPALPLDFKGGYVGYLGYELKALCPDAAGRPNAHASAHPDAALLFADRLIAFDHRPAEPHHPAGPEPVRVLADEYGEGRDALHVPAGVLPRLRRRFRRLKYHHIYIYIYIYIRHTDTQTHRHRHENGIEAP